jgi:hypothetical protein
MIAYRERHGPMTDVEIGKNYAENWIAAAADCDGG